MNRYCVCCSGRSTPSPIGITSSTVTVPLRSLNRTSYGLSLSISCRYAIEGGLLALRAGGSVTLAQRPEGDQQELSVTVEEYLPRLAARTGAPAWTGILYAKGQSPFHTAVSRRYFELLLRSRDS